MIEVRFHGRGGQGAKLASRILGTSGFLAGLFAQDFALFGAERRGAPVVSCTRLSTEPIERRGYLDEPDFIVVLEDSLLTEARAQVLHGIHPATPVFIDSAVLVETVRSGITPAANLICLDLSGLSRRVTGHGLISAAAAGVAAKCVPAITIEQLGEAVRIELKEFGLSRELIEKNALAASEAYELTPAVALPARSEALRRSLENIPQSLPTLRSAQFTGPTIQRPGSAALRNTGSWRMERPEIALEKCKRCFLCYLYCPDSAILLDPENYPHIDYEHCKGCMICYEECPTDAIARRLEA